LAPQWPHTFLFLESPLVVDDRINEAGVSTAYQAGAQCSSVEWTRVKVAVGNVVAPALQPKLAGLLLKSAPLDVSFCEVTRDVGDT